MNLAPRQCRFIECLLKRPHSREELGGLIGSLNVPDVKLRLIKKGLDIKCERIEMLDRDGKKSKPGIYSFPDEQAKVDAKKMLERGATQSSTDIQNNLAKQSDGDDSNT